jgi:hypothetical protein
VPIFRVTTGSARKTLLDKRASTQSAFEKKRIIIGAFVGGTEANIKKAVEVARSVKGVTSVKDDMRVKGRR